MVSSVLSEHTFSSAGITISKHHNRLKGDIVKALQFLKCAILKDLLQVQQPISVLELELEIVDDDRDFDWVDIKKADLVIEIDTDSE